MIVNVSVEANLKETCFYFHKKYSPPLNAVVSGPRANLLPVPDIVDLPLRITNCRFLLLRLYSVREAWFVSTCHSRQGNSCVRAPLRSRSHLASRNTIGPEVKVSRNAVPIKELLLVRRSG